MANLLAVESSRGQIYRWAYRLLHNDHDALDATQAVLLKLLALGPAAVERPQAWLRRVTVNHCLDVLRRRRELSGLPLSVPVAGEPDARAAGAERRERVGQALAVLTDVQRLVVLAKTYDGDSFETIARWLGLSASTVKTHYVRALKKMRGALQSCQGEL